MSQRLRNEWAFGKVRAETSVYYLHVENNFPSGDLVVVVSQGLTGYKI